jgi:hypothetical protein
MPEFFRLADVVEDIVARLFPAISGAPEIAQRFSSVRFWASVSPVMPTVSMSGSLTKPVCCAVACWAWSKLHSARDSDADWP